MKAYPLEFILVMKAYPKTNHIFQNWKNIICVISLKLKLLIKLTFYSLSTSFQEAINSRIAIKSLIHSSINFSKKPQKKIPASCQQNILHASIMLQNEPKWQNDASIIAAFWFEFQNLFRGFPFIILFWLNYCRLVSNVLRYSTEWPGCRGSLSKFHWNNGTIGLS